MTGPMRIQRKRERGWRLPDDTVIVDRTTKWGNPFKVGEQNPFGTVTRDNRHAVSLYLGFAPQNEELIRAARAELAGKNLACWCTLCEEHAHGKPIGDLCWRCEPCHVDVLLHLANGTGQVGVPELDGAAIETFLQLAGRATEGPWHYHRDALIPHPSADWGWVLAADGLKVADTHARARTTDDEDSAARAMKADPPQIQANGRFVAACRLMAPALAREVLRLRVENERLKLGLDATDGSRP